MGWVSANKRPTGCGGKVRFAEDDGYPVSFLGTVELELENMAVRVIRQVSLV